MTAEALCLVGILPAKTIVLIPAVECSARYAQHTKCLLGRQVRLLHQPDDLKLLKRAAVVSILPGVEASDLRGGLVYSVERFYSAKYTDVICDRYVALGLFTTRVEINREV